MVAFRGPRRNLLRWGERSAHFAQTAQRFLCESGAASDRKRKKERTVDALALGGDEGRGKLR